MQETGIRNGAFGADKFGFKGLKAVHWNLLEPPLYEHAIAHGEAEIAAGGALVAETGVHTGRSPKDKFILRDAHTEKTVWWDNNGALTPEQFQLLYDDFLAHAKGKELFAQDLYGGADPQYRIKTRVYTELAWHSLFIRTLLIRPERAELAHFAPELTIVCLPSFKADPKRHGCRSETIIAIDFTRKIVLIGGTSYAGEMKKSVFTTLNYYLPAESVMPMHCSANVGPAGDVALFFGLSGTGKTTLSADPKRTLIGDDEHGWGPQGVFNFEGGCYAKCIKLSAEAEPEIFATTQRFGTIMENVVIDPVTRIPDFDDGSKTENTRAAYPLDFIPNASKTGRAGHAEEHHHADGRRLRRDAADRQALAGRGDVSLPLGLHRQGRRHRKGREGSGGDVLHLLRRAVPAAASVGVRQSAARADRRARCRLLAGEHRLDRRQVRRRPPHADQGDAHAAWRPCSTARSRTRASGTIPISASRCRPRCPASSRICSIRSRPGRIRASSTRRRASWSRCSSRTSSSSSRTSMPT